MIEVSEGVPHSLRPVLWPRLLDIEAKKERLGLAYKDVISTMIFCTLTINDWTLGQILTGSEGSSSNAQCCRQIEKDLLRTLPTNICFAKPQSVGVQRSWCKHVYPFQHQHHRHHHHYHHQHHHHHHYVQDRDGESFTTG